MYSRLKSYFCLIGAVFFLILSILVWRHHQKLHYRRFLDISDNLSLRTANNDTVGLSSLLRALDGTLTDTVINSQAFGTLGREIQTQNTLIEVYEYENSRVASETYDALTQSSGLAEAFGLDATQIHQENNFILYIKPYVKNTN